MHIMLRALKREGEGVRKESTAVFRPVFWIYDIWRIYYFKLFFKIYLNESKLYMQSVNLRCLGT